MSSTEVALKDQVAVFAGGTAGIGLASARRLLEDGFGAAVLVGRSEERGLAARDQLRVDYPAARIEYSAVDLLDPAATAAFADDVKRRFGRVDVLLTTTHGGSSPSPLTEIPIERIGSLLGNQAVSPMLVAKALLSMMEEQRRGSIIIVSSDAAKVPTPGEAVVGAAMAALTVFGKTLAMEVKRHGVRVNVISPSVVAGTSEYARQMETEFGKRLFAKIDKLAGLGIPDADDLADLVSFLAGPDSTRITGQSISINGGISAV